MAAHAAVEQSALCCTFDGRNGPLEPFETNPPQQWRRGDQNALEAGIKALKQPGMTHAPEAQGKRPRAPGPLPGGLERGRLGRCQSCLCFP